MILVGFAFWEGAPGVEPDVLTKVSCLAGALLGVGWGLKMAISGGAHPGKKDPHAMTDEDHAAFLATCWAGKQDPTLVWAAASLGSSDGRTLVPLNPRDETS